MRDLSRVAASGIGKSRGYAFVSFTQHADALHALRATNNKREIFGDKKVCAVLYLLGCHYTVAVYKCLTVCELPQTLHISNKVHARQAALARL